ncbi:acetyl-CoA C-acetyltransferase [Engelhardtia mirabilis]|uniref:Acetyl-CoA acetyltransferase n=1 Tax=Engelhardtia mirabilis TaxID=2528011 RepID=A0A518BHR9_9BACT|nr:Acetyl-CoA acetyltransferase [Planctomycetes bacterium Pla133]QDV00856.1 Acetyl-CoA acetyltransferase [Planctomycetes bacterium Pla86]
MKEAVIVSACRTPIGKFQGGLSGFRAPQLGGLAIAEALRRAGVDAGLVEEVIMGNVLQAGLGQNPARQAAIAGGVPTSVGSVTINKVCGSGLKAVMLAAQAIRAGDADVLVAGGMESMTQAPYLLPEARAGVRLGHGKLLDSMVNDGLWDIYNDFHMGMTGELVADKHDISRAAQDEFAANSHRKAAAATEAGRFDAEKFTVEVPQRKADPIAFTTDETIRAGMTADSIAKLNPAFKRDGGTVTAANASAINDGACALVVMSAEKAAELGCKPMARITGYSTGGLDPEWVMMAPEVSIRKLSEKLGRKASDFDLHEINEAFSSAACALTRVLDLDPEKVNVNGGAVALGHPIGASGARILTTLLYAMAQRGAQTGMASLCLGGGNAVSLAVEAL